MAVEQAFPQISDLSTKRETIDRRRVLLLLLRDVPSAVMFCELASDTLGLGLDIARITPDVPRESVRPPPTPGWLETRNVDREVLVKDKDGHEKYLKDMVSSDITLRSIMKEVYKDLRQNKDADRPSIGDVIKKHIEFAQKELAKDTEHMYSIKDAIHIAFFTMAATYSPYFTLGEIYKTFGVDMTMDGVLTDDLYTSKAFNERFPLVYPQNPSSGPDKAVHFLNFAFLAMMLLYCDRYELSDYDRIPLGATVAGSAGDLLMGWHWGHQEAKMRTIVFIGQYMWEAKETEDWYLSMKEKKQYIKPNGGMFDESLDKDISANWEGIETALLLMNASSSEDVERITSELDKRLWDGSGSSF